MDQLTQEIYTQLLELYVYDLEVELLAEKLTKVTPPQVPITPYPWDRNKTWPDQTPYIPPNPWNTPYYYGPPYKVTSLAGDSVKYSDEYDAYYDPINNVWIDDICSDPTCDYCAERPDRPEKPLP